MATGVDKSPFALKRHQAVTFYSDYVFFTEVKTMTRQVIRHILLQQIQLDRE